MRPREPARLIGWDVGGAHLKACLLQDGQVLAANVATVRVAGHLGATSGQGRLRSMASASSSRRCSSK